MYAGTSGITFLQNTVDGSQPIAIFNSLDKSVEFFGNVNVPNFYNKTEVDAIDDELSALILNTYTKPEVEALISNINLTLDFKLLHHLFLCEISMIHDYM